MSKNFPFQIIKNSNKGLTVLEQGLPLPSIKKEKKNGKSMLEDMKLRFIVPSMVQESQQSVKPLGKVVGKQMKFSQKGSIYG